MRIGETYHGFTLDSIHPIEEFHVDAYRFTHIASGADLLWLSCDDTNRTFCISFKTLPENNTGVFHILEHSVLCGSRKFPLREPFVDLLKGSLQTFLNAMTFPDKTMYPVASTNEKDFVNLMDVYMDAVLHPRIDTTEEIFLQEGWHLNLPADGKPASMSGVVYNEMKGSYSSPDSVLYHTLQKEMLPDTCYSFSSGGDPVYIPDLTYDEFVATHRKFYHPENSYIYLYGEMDIEEKLKFLDEKYLSEYKKNGNSFNISWQKAVGERNVHEYYEIAESEELSRNSIIAKSIALCDFNQKKTLLGMRILLSALTSSNESPLTTAIMEAKLGDEFSAWVDDGIQQPYLTFRLKKTDPDQRNAFITLLNDTLKKIAEEGIDRSLLEAELNRFEFDMRELNFGRTPGVSLAIQVMDTWLYGGDPLETLRNRAVLKELRAGLDDGFFEELIKRHLLTPEHSVTLTLEPSKTIANERLQREQARADKFVAQMDETATQAYKEKIEKFDRFQSTQDSPETRALLPHLERKDLEEQISVTTCKESICNGAPLRLYDLPTNGITYLRLYFDISAFPKSDWNKLALLSDVLFECATENYDALSYQKHILSDMGTLSSSLDWITEVNGDKKFVPYFSIFASFLDTNAVQGKHLIEEGLLRTVFSEDQLKKLIKQLYVYKEAKLIRSGNSFATAHAGRGELLSHEFEDETQFVGYYHFLKDLCNDLNARITEITADLKSLLSRIIDSDTLTVSLLCDETAQEAYKKAPLQIPHLGGRKKVLIPFESKHVSEGMKIPGAVVYNAIVGNFDALGYEFTGVLNVLSRIISLDYLWTQVRMRGGAYGCSCSISSNGAFSMASYRDPNVENTYEIYRSLPDFIRNLSVDESEMTKYVIGAFSIYDQPKRVWNEVYACDIRDFSNLTVERRQKTRSASLHTSLDDIRQMADMLADVLNHSSICTVGAADKIIDSETLFEKITV